MVTAENNPFSVSKIHNLPYQFKVFDMVTLFEKWVGQNSRGVIKGNHGVGKTTLLREFISLLISKNETVKVIFLNDNKKLGLKDFFELLRLEKKFILAIDGWEQINFFYKSLLFIKIKSLKGFICTSHHKSVFSVIFEANSDFETFSVLVSKLIEPYNMESLPDLGFLYAKHNGNIRDCLFELYDCVANGNCM